MFFGATGDLAYKKIFPALQAMIKRGHLSVPVVGVAKSGRSLDQLRARAHDSLEKHGGVDLAAFERLEQSACGMSTPRRFRQFGKSWAQRNGRRTILPFRPRCSKQSWNN